MSAIDPRAGRRFLAGFVLLAVLSGITLGIAKVTTTLYALSLQASPLQLALLGAAQSVGILAVSLPVGLMVDRYGAQRLFVIGSLLVTALYALVPASGQLWFLLACTTAVSFAMPLRFISLSAVFMEELARIGEARAGWFRGSHMMGMFLIGPALAASVVAAIGYAGSYWLIAGLLLLTAAMAPLAFPGERGRKAPGAARQLSWRSIGNQLALLKTEAALRATCVSEFFAMALNMFYAFFIVVLAIEVFGFSSQAASALISLQGGAFIAALFGMGGLLARRGEGFIHRLSDVCIVAALLVLGLGRDSLCLWLGGPLLGLGLGALQTVNLSRFAHLGRQLGQGTVSSLAALLGPAGATAGSLVGALVGSPAQLQTLFLAFIPVFAVFAWQHRRHGQAARLFNEPSLENLK
ncbi:MAG: MFS transporter [Zoogloea sp.]|jgi:predicted MFS family arabinose efflux permease|uniref:MFS transporter n=1 Tax=Zoogloea sp. TaxID=49181 RepID=UPI00260B508C|nr:MFS transporter [Zoogloea sp.]MDD3327869.1 MFS transporter [Zoogloea sp.]